MNNRFSEELFLTNKTGSMLYHKYAENMPIIDYHCHLQPVEIAENKEFEDLGEMWLKGDHYKWRFSIFPSATSSLSRVLRLERCICSCSAGINRKSSLHLVRIGTEEIF